MQLKRLVVPALVLVGAVALGAGCSAASQDTTDQSSSRASQGGADDDQGASDAPNTPPKGSNCVSTIAIKNTFGGNGVIPRDLNERGQIAGSAFIAGVDVHTHAFFWDGGALVDLGTLGGKESDALAVNDRGEVVGYAAKDGETSSSLATLWRNGTTVELGTLGGSFSIAGHINNATQIVGNSLTAEGETHAFLWENGVMRDLGTLGGKFSSALRINEAGQIMGHSEVVGDSKRHVFFWQNGVMKDLGPERPEDLNARGDVLLANSPNLYLVHDGTRAQVAPPGAVLTGARDLNDRGEVVGAANRADGTTFSFLWRNGVTTTIGSDTVTGLALNNHAQVVGFVGRHEPRALSWKDGEITYLVPENESAIALAINDRGQIMGTSTGNSEGRLWEVQSCNGGDKDAGVEDSGGGSDGGGKTW